MDQLLRNNVRTITTWLGQVIIENEGMAFYRKVEKVRLLCKDLRQSRSIGKTGRLKRFLLGLSIKEAHYIARAFTLYFQLVNIAEENHRIRRILLSEQDPQHPGPMSINRLFQELREKRTGSKKVNDVLKQLHIEPVLTAHPTEARRKTVIRHLRRIQTWFFDLDRTDLTWRQRERLKEHILESLEMLWQSKHIRDRAIRIEDEIKYVLNFFTQTIFHALSDFQESARKGLNSFYPTLSFPSHAVQFGSWVGGDRDGNPGVLPETSRFTLEQHRNIVIDHYKIRLNHLFSLLTSAKRFEKVDKALEQSVARDLRVFPVLRRRFKTSEPGEYYRMKLHGMWRRLRNTQSRVGPRYQRSSEFIADLAIVQKSLRSHHGHRVADGPVQSLIDEVGLFGFFLARLDFRQHADDIREAVKDILGYWPSPHQWPDLVKNPPLNIRVLESKTKKLLRIYRTQKELQEEFGPRSTDHAILSMTESADDVWALLFIARKAGLLRHRKQKPGRPTWKISVDVVPLFETIPDLRQARLIMNRLWSDPFYREILNSREGLQEIMLGYSDSNKSGGYFAANFELFNVKRVLAGLAKKSRVKLRFFHGKGGSIDRGGGPAHRAVLASPDSANGFQLRITEQGEVISHKYGHPVLAQRNLEQMTSAVISAGLFPSNKKISEANRVRFEKVISELSEYSMREYRDLVYETPEFQTYFQQAAPIDLIRKIQISSRPAFREDKFDFKNLRAIPWVFSWTQNRHLLSAWYGIGGGIEEYIRIHGRKGETLLKKMYREWPFFESLIENAHVSLAKSDLMISKRYASLIKEEDVRDDVFKRIESEYHRSIKYVLKVSGQKKLLQRFPVLMESIRLRNPYVDPLNALQVEYLRLWRNKRLSEKKRREVLLVLLMTVNGIAFGMKSTG